MKVLLIGIFVYFILLQIPKWKEYLAMEKTETNQKHYANLLIPNELEERITKVQEFIKQQDKKVYILDAEAAVYHIPLDIYYKDYDMFLKGNLGGKGEEGQIEKLKEDTEAIVLIRKGNYTRNWQTPELVREYVLDNMNKIGEIELFDIYE